MRASPVIDDLPCTRARQVLSAALDDEASQGELLAAASHLGSCPRCRQFAAQIVGVTRELRSVRLGRTGLPR